MLFITKQDIHIHKKPSDSINYHLIKNTKLDKEKKRIFEQNRPWQLLSINHFIFFSLWLKICQYKEEILIELTDKHFIVIDRAAALLKSVVYYKIMHKWTLQKWALKAHYLSKNYLSIYIPNKENKRTSRKCA